MCVHLLHAGRGLNLILGRAAYPTARRSPLTIPRIQWSCDALIFKLRVRDNNNSLRPLWSQLITDAIAKKKNELFGNMYFDWGFGGCFFGYCCKIYFFISFWNNSLIYLFKKKACLKKKLKFCLKKPKDTFAVWVCFIC